MLLKFKKAFKSFKKFQKYLNFGWKHSFPIIFDVYGCKKFDDLFKQSKEKRG